MRWWWWALIGCTTPPVDAPDPGVDGGDTGAVVDTASGTMDSGTEDSDRGDTDRGDTDPPGVTTSARCEALATPLANPPRFYEDNPTLTDVGQGDWEVGAPTDLGLDGDRLASLGDVLEGLPYVWSVIVVRHGTIAFERYLHGGAADQSNNVHSASKSVLGALVGTLVDDGLLALDTLVADVLPDELAGADPLAAELTVEHLLTMTAGLRWIEDVSEARIERETDWVKAIAELPWDDPPGEVFNYSTGQAHLLGAVVAEAAGKSLCDLAIERIYDPIGVTVDRWGRDPQGRFSGGYNVYLTARELARFGQLALDGGAWDGVRVVPEDWVAAMRAPQVWTGGGWDYGYQWWLPRTPYGMDIAWGYGGQFVYVLEEHDLVVVFTTNTRTYAPNFEGHALVDHFVVPAVIGP